VSGIVGVVHVDGRRADAELLGRMARARAHRGPDGQSAWVDGPAGLAHRRLASGAPKAKQPAIHAVDGRVAVWDGWLAEPFDGFRGAPGEFAVTIWDKTERTLVCARDAFGTKPLYYHWDGRRLLFGSEVGALFEDASVPRRPDAATIADSLLMDFRDPGATFFAGIRRVPPGHTLHLGERGPSLRRYWTPDGRPRRGDHAEHAARFAAALRDAVADRLADAPAAGILLSGGIDSTLVARVAGTLRAPLAALTRLHEGFLAEDWDAIAALERSRAIAPPRISEGIPLLDMLLASAEPPNDDGYPVLPALLDAQAAAEFRVLLTGIGGDELSTAAERGALGKRLGTLRWRRAWREAGEQARAYGGRGRRATADVLWSAAPVGFRRLARQLTRRDAPRWLVSRLARERRAAPRVLEPLPVASPTAAAVWRALTAPRFTFALEKLDAEAAGLGIEPRHPYLDRRVVECFLATPADVLVRHGYRKQFVQRALGGPAPFRTVEDSREHRPMPAPDGELRREAEGLAQGLFRRDARVFDYVERAEAERMRDRYLAGDLRPGAHLWNFLLLETWLSRTFA
jgi:asparagine synthase (glutamine-hydrolysing)